MARRFPQLVTFAHAGRTPAVYVTPMIGHHGRSAIEPFLATAGGALGIIGGIVKIGGGGGRDLGGLRSNIIPRGGVQGRARSTPRWGERSEGQRPCLTGVVLIWIQGLTTPPTGFAFAVGFGVGLMC